MNEDRLDEFDNRLRRRIDAHRQHREESSRATLGESGDTHQPPDFTGMSIYEAAEAYDSWASARITMHRGRDLTVKSPAAADKKTPEEPAAGAIKPATSLDTLDKTMVDDFGLARFLPDGGPRSGTTLCATRQEFLAPICDYLGTSQGTAGQWLNNAELETPGSSAVNPLTKIAVHIPGQGCYVNGWELARRHDLTNSSRVLDDGAAFREAARAIGEEKWGFGFVTRYTAYGAEKLERRLCRWDLAARLGVETDGETKSRQLAKQLRRVSCLAEEGWASWVGEYLAWRSDPAGEEPGVRSGFRLAQLVDGIEHLSGIVPLKELVGGLLDAVRWIFLQTEIGPTLIHESTRCLQRLYDHDDSRTCRLRTHIARMLIGKMEARLGCCPCRTR